MIEVARINCHPEPCERCRQRRAETFCRRLYVCLRCSFELEAEDE